MKKLFFFAALGAAALTGCSEGQVYNNDAAASGNEITIRGTLEKTVNGRASAMTTERFNSFRVFAFQHQLSVADNATFEETGGNQNEWLSAVAYKKTNPGPHQGGNPVWEYSPKAYWPKDYTNGYYMSFFAFSPIVDQNMIDNGGYPIDIEPAISAFEYRVPYDQRGWVYKQDGSAIVPGTEMKVAEDLLVAAKTNIILPQSLAVDFDFYHALSAATFSATVTDEFTYVIKEIWIEGLANQGRFSYGNYSDQAGKWDDAAATPIPLQGDEYIQSGIPDGSYLVPTPSAGVSLRRAGVSPGEYKSLLTQNDFLLVLPQTTQPISPYDPVSAVVNVHYEVWEGDRLLYSTRNVDDPNNPTPATFSYNNGFEQGKFYNFTFTLNAQNPLEPIVMKVNEVKEWGEPSPSPTPLN